jgi:Omp85 superfamily domain
MSTTGSAAAPGTRRRLSRALIRSIPCMLAVASPLAAQFPVWSTCRDSVGGSPCGSRRISRRERLEVEALYNAPATRRASAPFSLARDSILRSSLAVVGGPVRIAGTIEGSLLVLNGDVTFERSAKVVGSVAILGGRAFGTDSASLGALRSEPDSVTYRLEDGELRLDAPLDEVWHLIGRGEPKAGIGMRLALMRTYNRVEGLPIELGPRLRYRTPAGVVAADLFGILRTGERLEWSDNNVGYSGRIELRIGRAEHFSLGARFYDVVTPVEDWQLSDVEVGLASFLGHSDYRDYFDRRGGSATLGFRDGRSVRASVEYSNERWKPRSTLNPFSIWKNEEPWRANPEFDRARYSRLQLRWSYDTRTDPVRPRSGWWLQGEYELGDGTQDTFGTEVAPPVAAGVNRDVQYGRAMLDLRRYSRLSPRAQVNTRVMAGGWLHGDALPLQRRMSVSGPGANGGFAFRQRVTAPDRLQCSGSGELSGSPALCDRMLLLSVDYRHDIAWIVDLFAGRRLIQPDRSGYGGWLLFTDIGRGWLVAPRAQYDRSVADAPKGLEAFHTSVGAGLELGQGGVYVAKALGAPPSRGVQVFLRLVRRY